MRSLKIYILLAGFVLSLNVKAQEAEELVFTETSHDFGKIKEENGPVIHQFNFINKGLNPVKILSVNASCGCTTPDWTKEEIQPGASGYIQAQYNPKNRPGSFHKSLTVKTSVSDTPVRLYIRGHVVPKPKSVEDELPTLMGGLRVKYRSFNMGKVKTTDEPEVREFTVYNASDTAISFLREYLSPDHIKVEFVPQTLQAAQYGVIKVIYYAARKKNFGFNSDNVTFFTTEEEDAATKSISVYATVEEYFPPMTPEELENAPQLKIEETIHDFGRIAPDQKISTTFKLVNTGANLLNIRQIRPNCSCVSADVSGNNIERGKSAELRVTFYPSGRKGSQQKSITIYSNDPRAAAQRITIKAYIESY